jgi:replicative DNA helicase
LTPFDGAPWPVEAPDHRGVFDGVAGWVAGGIDGGVGEPAPPIEPDSPEEAEAARAAARVSRIEKVAEQFEEQFEARAVATERWRRRQVDEASAARRLRILDGWAFLADEEEAEVAIWGDGERWAWAPGEPLMLFGGNGVFKSTLSHLLVFARIGLIGPDGSPRADHVEVGPDSPVEEWGRVLGMPVRPTDGNVFYLAGDRPKQIRRAMRRLRRDWMCDVLHDRLVVHEGPLPFEVTDGKDALADLAEQHKAADVFVDSVKDYCARPSDEECANGYNRARQECVARGMQWVEDHHNRKQQQGQGRTNTIEDVYGSRWLTAGTGSILSMWTEDEQAPVVDIRQIKSPGELLPHLKVTVDRQAGLMASGVKPDPITYVRGFGPTGVSVEEYARFSGQSKNAARNWLNARITSGQFEHAPRHPDGLTRFRTVLGVVADRPQGVWQQDGLDF